MVDSCTRVGTRCYRIPAPPTQQLAPTQAHPWPPTDRHRHRVTFWRATTTLASGRDLFRPWPGWCMCSRVSLFDPRTSEMRRHSFLPRSTTDPVQLPLDLSEESASGTDTAHTEGTTRQTSRWKGRQEVVLLPAIHLCDHTTPTLRRASLFLPSSSSYFSLCLLPRFSLRLR